MKFPRWSYLVLFLVLVSFLSVAFLTSKGSTATLPVIEVDGKLITSHGDDFVHHVDKDQYNLVSQTGTYTLNFASSDPVLPETTSVHVHGHQNGKTVNVDSITPSQNSAVVAGTSGPQSVLVLMVNYSNDTSQPYTSDDAKGIMFTNPDSVANYYKETSWGKLTMTGDVKGWYTIPASNSTCDPSTWASQADQAATAAGVNLSAYKYHVYAMSSTPACWWGGYSYIPGTHSWLSGSWGMSLYIGAHELGHAFGTHHASSYNCTVNNVRVALSANLSDCSPDEYGDPFSVMGSGYNRQQTNFARANFGWLTNTNTLDISQNGTYSLQAIEPNNPTGVVALRLGRSAVNYSVLNYFLLELRQPYGAYFDNFSASDPAVNGVLVRIVPSYFNTSQSWLVDTTPDTNDFNDAALAVGKSVYDPMRNVTLTLLSLGPNGASVKVTFGPNADVTPPTAPSNLRATVNKQKQVTLKWSSPRNTTGVVGYGIYRNGVYISGTSPSSSSFVDYSAPAGTNTYYLKSFDSSINLSAPSNTVTVKL